MHNLLRPHIDIMRATKNDFDKFVGLHEHVEKINR